MFLQEQDGDNLRIDSSKPAVIRTYLPAESYDPATVDRIRDGLWHLGLTDGATHDTKARFAFVMGDFRRIHRSGIIACHYRAAEWRHKAVELAAHDLLQRLDRKAGIS